MKFFVFKGVGKDAPLVTKADLDGYGDKFVPQLCTTCHGGRLSVIRNGSRPTREDVLNKMEAHFREFDIANFKFPRPGKPIDDPSRSIPMSDEESAFRTMNLVVLEHTNPPDAIKDLINGWYPNKTGNQDTKFVPDGWGGKSATRGQPIHDLYQNVVAKSCRTCHVALARQELPLDPIDFHSFENFKDYGPTILNYVFSKQVDDQSRRMPHAMITFKNFWKSDPPTVLANDLTDLLGVTIPADFITAGGDGGTARGGGINSDTLLDEHAAVSVTATTVAFNTASGGVGFSAKENNGRLEVKPSIGMGDAGGVFSEPSSPSAQSTTTLHSSIIARNFGDTDDFTDNIALQADDLRGEFVSRDFNLIGKSGDFTFSKGETSHNLLDDNPKLGLLRNNGGPTSTHALLEGSPAIDKGDNRILNVATTDQRRFSRKIGDAVDIGAFEFGGTERDLGSVVVTRGGFYFNPKTQRYVQQVTIRNTGNTSIDGPLRLALDDLSNNVALSNKDGIDSQFGNIPFVSINTGTDNIFSAGESVSVTLEFTDPDNTAIKYRPRVLEVVSGP